MRFFSFLAAAFFATTAAASAQDLAAYASVVPTGAPAAPAPVAAASHELPMVEAFPATTQLVGRVNTANGPLPGAVVHINGSKEMAVTDADGQFHVTVPVGTVVKATASYAGFADETLTLDNDHANVQLNTVRTVAVDKKHQLKAYIKTARKQAKRSLRRVAH